MLVLCASCGENHNDEGLVGANINLEIVNSKGENLLEPESANCIVSPNTTITIDGFGTQSIPVFEDTTLWTFGNKKAFFRHHSVDGGMKLNFSPFFGANEDEVITIDWGNGVEKDVIIFSYRYSIVTDITINGKEPVWNGADSLRYWTYVKDMP